MQHSTQPINLFTQHVAPVMHNGQAYHFRTTEGAEKFLAVVGKRAARAINCTPVGSTRASDVHKRPQRAGYRPECIRRLEVRAGLTVISTEPPDGNRPTPALRIVHAADERAAA